MSSQTPRSAGSRRRIAGERRPRSVPETPESTVAPESVDRGEEQASPEPEPAARRPRKTRQPRQSRQPRQPRQPRQSRVRATSGGPSWRTVVIAGSVALVLLLVAGLLSLGVWSFFSVRDADRVEEASRTAPAAAERAAATILSYDYRSLPADQKAAERYMTPSYRKDYAATFQKLVRPNAGKVRARVKAEVKASGVSHADRDRVDVLVYVNQTTVSTANGGDPQLALNRVRMRMDRSGSGSWLVSDITSY